MDSRDRLGYEVELENLLGGPIPRLQNQDKGAEAVGSRNKPLYVTSYTSLFYSVRMHMIPGHSRNRLLRRFWLLAR